ncbi:hypothetical protein [Nostoc sp.]|uniref:hypothetical protein n=1 Tax=Nostoc sp. TaxID=1180 RepID=UPI002FF8EEE8
MRLKKNLGVTIQERSRRRSASAHSGQNQDACGLALEARYKPIKFDTQEDIKIPQK